MCDLSEICANVQPNRQTDVKSERLRIQGSVIDKDNSCERKQPCLMSGRWDIVCSCLSHIKNPTKKQVDLMAIEGTVI